MYLPKYYIYFREYEDSVNLMCHVYEPNLNIGQHTINSKTWDLLINVRFLYFDSLYLRL